MVGGVTVGWVREASGVVGELGWVGRGFRGVGGPIKGGGWGPFAIDRHGCDRKAVGRGQTLEAAGRGCEGRL